MIEFIASFGCEMKKVTISHVATGSGGYQLLVDNYYQGDLIKRGGVWVLLSPKNKLTLDDIQVLGALIDQKGQEFSTGQSS